MVVALLSLALLMLVMACKSSSEPQRNDRGDLLLEQYREMGRMQYEKEVGPKDMYGANYEWTWEEEDDPKSYPVHYTLYEAYRQGWIEACENDPLREAPCAGTAGPSDIGEKFWSPDLEESFMGFCTAYDGLDQKTYCGCLLREFKANGYTTLAPSTIMDREQIRLVGEDKLEVQDGDELDDLEREAAIKCLREISSESATPSATAAVDTPTTGAAATKAPEQQQNYEFLGQAPPDTYHFLIDNKSIDLTVNTMVDSHIRQTVSLTVDGQQIDHLPQPDFSQYAGTPGTTSDYMSGDVQVVLGQYVEVDIVYPVFLQGDGFCCPSGGKIHELWRVTPAGFELVLQTQVSRIAEGRHYQEYRA